MRCLIAHQTNDYRPGRLFPYLWHCRVVGHAWAIAALFETQTCTKCGAQQRYGSAMGYQDARTGKWVEHRSWHGTFSKR